MKNMLKAMGLALAMGVAMLVQGAAAQEVTINAVTLVPKQIPIAGPFRMFVEEVNEKFAGRVKINWRGGPEVMPPFKQAEGVRNGAMDMTYTSPSYYEGLVPTSGTMNFSFKNYAEIAATNYHERMTELHAEKDLIYLGEIPASELDFLIYLRDDVYSLDAVKGKRIRVFPALLPLVKALGAEPIVLPIGEIYTAMERGTIDGYMQGPLSQAKQFKGQVKTVIYPGVYRAGFPVLVNKATWNKIPAATQKELQDFLRNDFAPRIDDIWAAPIANERKAMEEAGFRRLELKGNEAKRYEKIAMDAAWAGVAQKAGKPLADELRGMLDR